MLQAERFAWKESDFAALRTLGGPGSGNFGHAGRPGEVGGSAPSGLPPEAYFDQPLDSTGRPVPIRVNTVEEAIPLILAKKVVELPDVQRVNTLIQKLGEIALDAKAKGEKAPNYDLCNVSVAGTNLFCGSKLRTPEFPNGIPRIEMPVIPGKLKEDFIDTLMQEGIGHERGQTPASLLKASQAELIGTKVAELMTQTDFDPAVSTIFISRDNYVIDGHHRWAAVIGKDAEDNKLGDLQMNTIRLDLPVSELYHRAIAWSKAKGISGRGVER